MKQFRFRLEFEADSPDDAKQLLDKAIEFAKSVGQHPRNAMVTTADENGNFPEQPNA